MSAAELPPLVDEAALDRFLSTHLPDLHGTLTVERLSAGHSNETFVVRKGETEMVLRRPPRGPLLPTAHDVLREYRVISALITTDVPVPRPIVACDDTSVIGAPFYVMERIEGLIIRDSLPSALDTPEGYHAITDELITTLAKLHTVDVAATGLHTLGKGDRYIERQLRRWSDQLARTEIHTRTVPDLHAVGDWLRAHLPDTATAPTVVHGDFRFDNVIFAPQPIDGRAQIRAVLDWEMATLGDPLADLGYLLSFWREPGDPVQSLPSPMGTITGRDGFPTRAEAAALYEERSGRRVAHLNFYIALAIWKLAILLEGSYARHLAGTTDDPYFALLDKGVPELAARAHILTKSAG